MPRILDCSPTYLMSKRVHVVRLEVADTVDMDALLAAVAALEAQPEPTPAAAPSEPAPSAAPSEPAPSEPAQ